MNKKKSNVARRIIEIKTGASRIRDTESSAQLGDTKTNRLGVSHELMNNWNNLLYLFTYCLFISNRTSSPVEISAV